MCPVEADGVLETGYGPGAPPGDNLLNDFAQGMAAAFASIAAGRRARVSEDAELGLLLTDSASPALFGNAAVARRPLADHEWPEAARRMHAFYAEVEGGPFLLFSPWTTPDLTGAGFGPIGHPPLMVRMPAPLEDAGAAGLEVRRAVDGAGARDWERTLVDGFPEPALQPYRPGCLLPEAALDAPGWQWWVGYLDGRPVGTAAAHVSDRHVHVEFISTIESARGRGIGRALTAIATMADPARPALLISSDPGRSVYERLGYRSLLRFTLWSGHRTT
jgi:GNAT superfamily N-acetyltransferase